MLLLWCKSASCQRKWRKTGDGKCDVHSSHQATASVSEQPAASSPNMKHVWGLICSPLMGCQNAGLRGQRGSPASPPSLTQSACLTRATGQPLIWATISCLDSVSYTYTHAQKTHKKHAHTLTVTRFLGMFKTWACTLAYTHIFISSSLVGSLPGLQQSLTEETGFSELSHVPNSIGLLCKHGSLPLISSLFSTCTWLPRFYQ